MAANDDEEFDLDSFDESEDDGKTAFSEPYPDAPPAQPEPGADPLLSPPSYGTFEADDSSSGPPSRDESAPPPADYAYPQDVVEPDDDADRTLESEPSAHEAEAPPKRGLSAEPPRMVFEESYGELFTPPEPATSEPAPVESDAAPDPDPPPPPVDAPSPGASDLLAAMRRKQAELLQQRDEAAGAESEPQAPAPSLLEQMKRQLAERSRGGQAPAPGPAAEAETASGKKPQAPPESGEAPDLLAEMRRKQAALLAKLKKPTDEA